MRSKINRNWPKFAEISERLIRCGFIARCVVASVIGLSIAHAKFVKTMDEGHWLDARLRSIDHFSSAQQAVITKIAMNENETITKLSPKMGLVLARLIRNQDQIPHWTGREGDHDGKPPIGMMPVDHSEIIEVESEIVVDSSKASRTQISIQA